MVRLAVWPYLAWRIDHEGRRGWTGVHADAIVVAGARVRADGSASPALLRRIEKGVALHQAGVAPVLVCSGRGPGPVPEADWMADFALERGVAESHLIRERHSMTTAENALYTSRMVKGSRIVVVSDRAHVRRCVREFRHFFAQVEGVGVAMPRGTRLQQVGREVVIEAWRR